MKPLFVCPYVFPKTRLKRKYRLTLTKFQNSKVKPLLRREFNRKCVYCCSHDILPNIDTYSVDHYLPKEHFPELKFEYSNLYYACVSCNRKKRDFYPTSKHPGLFIPNPCEHVMFSHLKYLETEAHGKSQQGEFTIELLRLNSANLMKIRKGYISSVNIAAASLASILSTIKKIEWLLIKKPTVELQEDLQQALAEKKILHRHLNTLGAVPIK